MKKLFMTLAAVGMMLSAASCGSEPSASHSPESTSASPSVLDQATEEAAKTEIEPSAFQEKTEDPETDKASETEIEPVLSEEVFSPLPKDFSFSDYFSDFEDVEWSRVYLGNTLHFRQSDEDAVKKAIGAYRDSVLYDEALEEIKSLYSSDSELPWGWKTDAYRNMIDDSAAPEISLRTEVVCSWHTVFEETEGEEGDLILLRTAMPDSMFAWSGTDAYLYVPVYVNADGEAFLLSEACHQCFGDLKPIYIPDTRSIHVLFHFGHNEGGQGGAVYSFRNGVPKLELSGCPFTLHDGMLLGGFGWNYFNPFLFDSKNNEYFAVKSVSPSEELARMICGDPSVLESVPDAWEVYQKGNLQIIGGKYVSFHWGFPWSAATMVYNSAQNTFVPYERPICVTAQEGESEVRLRNVNLEETVFTTN